jgi:hypothetical protein
MYAIKVFNDVCNVHILSKNNSKQNTEIICPFLCCCKNENHFILSKGDDYYKNIDSMQNKSIEFFYDVNKEKISFALLYFGNY